MESMLLGKRVLRAVGMCALLALAVCRVAYAQVEVTGTVTSASGSNLQGVTVRIRGTNTTTTTGADGKYSISAAADAVLVFNAIGYKGVGQALNGRTTVDVVLEPSVAVLPEVVVTGYMEEQRKNMTGAGTSVDAQSIQRQTGASALQALDGRAAGVTIDNSGSPGSRTTVRIRGISSFQNNDPLYVIDGTPVQDTYLNFLNPDDIASVEVLKDASAASIYGSRASNGVILIETKRGKPGRRQVTLDVTTGVASPVNGYDNIVITNSLDYFKVVKTAFRNAGEKPPANIYGDSANPSVPAFIWPNNGSSQTTDTLNTASYSYPNNLIMPGSAGTNWWKAVFGTGQVRNANLSVSGGGDDNSYLVSFNYLNQQGTAAYTLYQRGGVRINTKFTMSRVTVGENLQINREQSYGGLDDNGLGEDNIVGKNIFQQPVVPIFDIAGNFASGKAPGLSNLSNPLMIATVGQHDVNTNDRMFGNVFGTLDASHGFSLTTRFGFNLDQNNFHSFSGITPENAEPSFNDGINENYNLFTEWTWSNTLNYARSFAKHNLTVLLGQEATKNTNRFEAASCANLLTTDVSERYIQDALCDPTTKNVSSVGSIASLMSFFGKADYNYAERYFLNVTVRRDGSSRLGPSHRWGTFPAVGLGWRVSNESFYPQNFFFSSMMLRAGFGITGNQLIPPDRIVSQLGGDRGATFYDISGGSKTVITPGFQITAIGNPNLKWEENRSLNVGVDLEFNQGKGSFSADVYNRKSNNLLFAPALPATAGAAAPPIVNIGKMQNKGYDLSLAYKGVIAGSTFWSVSVNGAHYHNEITKIDGTADFFFPANIIRDQNPVINMIGQPIGAFYGLVADGYYKDSLDAAPYWADGARPGRIKFKDLNGDGHITSADRAIIGSPHPTFTGGLDLGLRHGNWDLSATFFATLGNKIFNEEKYWYVFRYFDTNVRQDLLANSVVLNGPCNDVQGVCPGVVTNPGAKYPRLDANDAFSRQFSSYWVENGAYLRLRNIQIGYNLPTALIRWIPAARVYLQAENLFTITGYSGLDPSLPAPDVTGPAGDVRDQYLGIDQGVYPSNRTITIGISTSF